MTIFPMILFLMALVIGVVVFCVVIFVSAQKRNSKPKTPTQMTDNPYCKYYKK